MKKNKMMRTASALLVATLLSTSVIAGTFAKYTTSAEGSDTARVAKWGFEANNNSIVLTDLFKETYSNTKNVETVKSSTNGTDVIAPGTGGEAKFKFEYDTTSNNNIAAPEVEYIFAISTEGSSIESSIENNKNIVWSLDGKECTSTDADKSSWDVLLEEIAKLSGSDSVSSENGVVSASKEYKPGELPSKFYNDTSDTNNGSKEHTVSWEWKYNSDSTDTTTINAEDTADTAMGNADALANVTLKITVTATQVD